MIQQYGGSRGSGQFPISTTAQKVATLGAGIINSPTSQIWGFAITNNDAAITIYLAYSNAVTSTNYYRAIAPGQCFETSASIGLLGAAYLIAASGTPNVHLEVFG